jgi:hypothetical protein
MREKLLRIQTELIYAAMVGTMSLPDPVLAAAMGQFRAIGRALAPGGDAEFDQQLAELEEFFRVGPPLSDALRRMILDARPSQMKSVIRGYLINYVYDW